ncbi:uncharacterized protein LOC133785606 [Humulus lupulus]|uniref:uncharacterized protein LOC133785606 n=1 Tax=Humulus lupulus TaxID=3486 RepID=UPI002B40A00E|nr:uncharacterized protein LOC133785606 [Humulus lupulus]
MRYPSDVHSTYSIDILDSLSQRILDLHGEDGLDIVLREPMDLKKENVNTEVKETVVALNSGGEVSKEVLLLELIVSHEQLQPSVKSPPKLELKSLSEHLKYVYLDSKWVSPVQVVLKKSGITVVKNDEDELVPKRVQTVKKLKESMASTPIIQPPNWELPFEIMCDASDYAVGAVLGQKAGKVPHVIYYASRNLNDVQLNYSTTEKELLVPLKSYQETLHKLKRMRLSMMQSSTFGKSLIYRNIALVKSFEGVFPIMNFNLTLLSHILMLLEVILDQKEQPIKYMTSSFINPQSLKIHMHIVSFEYILLAMDYVSKWVEAKATKANNSKTVVDFIRSNIFVRIDTPKAIISD